MAIAKSGSIFGLILYGIWRGFNQGYTFAIYYCIVVLVLFFAFAFPVILKWRKKRKESVNGGE